VAGVGEDDTAITGRSSPFNLHLNGMWEGDAADDENIAWVKGVTAALGSHVVPGISMNFVTEADDASKVESWGAAKVERLRALKDRYDPSNLFRLNQNIRPTSG